MNFSSDDKLVKQVEDKLAGVPAFVPRRGAWVKTENNKVGKVLYTTTTKSGAKWARVEFIVTTRKGITKKRERSIWCSRLRSTE